jgi:26S proteasome regulatory subunit N2
MINENEQALQIHALKNLNKMVDYAWHEIADTLPKIESFVENPNFPERSLAASVASKVFYYLEEFDEALRLALEAGDLFDLNESSKYVETLINKCIDRYCKLRQELT